MITQKSNKAHSNSLASLRLDLALLFDFLNKNGINTLVEHGFISETYLNEHCKNEKRKRWHFRN